MTMRGINSLADKLKLWQQLRAGTGRLLDDLPHLRPEVTTFETELRDLVAIDEEHAATTARLRELTRRRAEAQVRVRGLRNRIAATLQGHYGPESDTLIEYGIAPRRRRPRRKPEPETPTISEVPTEPVEE